MRLAGLRWRREEALRRGRREEAMLGAPVSASKVGMSQARADAFTLVEVTASDGEARRWCILLPSPRFVRQKVPSIVRVSVMEGRSTRSRVTLSDAILQVGQASPFKKARSQRRARANTGSTTSSTDQTQLSTHDQGDDGRQLSPPLEDGSLAEGKNGKRSASPPFRDDYGQPSTPTQGREFKRLKTDLDLDKSDEVKPQKQSRFLARVKYIAAQKPHSTGHSRPPSNSPPPPPQIGRASSVPIFPSQSSLPQIDLRHPPPSPSRGRSRPPSKESTPKLRIQPLPATAPSLEAIQDGPENMNVDLPTVQTAAIPPSVVPPRDPDATPADETRLSRGQVIHESLTEPVSPKVRFSEVVHTKQLETPVVDRDTWLGGMSPLTPAETPHPSQFQATQASLEAAAPSKQASEEARIPPPKFEPKVPLKRASATAASSSLNGKASMNLAPKRSAASSVKTAAVVKAGRVTASGSKEQSKISSFLVKKTSSKIFSTGPSKEPSRPPPGRVKMGMKPKQRKEARQSTVPPPLIPLPDETENDMTNAPAAGHDMDDQVVAPGHLEVFTERPSLSASGEAHVDTRAEDDSTLGGLEDGKSPAPVNKSLPADCEVSEGAEQVLDKVDSPQLQPTSLPPVPPEPEEILERLYTLGVQSDDAPLPLHEPEEALHNRLMIPASQPGEDAVTATEHPAVQPSEESDQRAEQPPIPGVELANEGVLPQTFDQPSDQPAPQPGPLTADEELTTAEDVEMMEPGMDEQEPAVSGDEASTALEEKDAMSEEKETTVSKEIEPIVLEEKEPIVSEQKEPAVSEREEPAGLDSQVSVPAPKETRRSGRQTKLPVPRQPSAVASTSRLTRTTRSSSSKQVERAPKAPEPPRGRQIASKPGPSRRLPSTRSRASSVVPTKAPEGASDLLPASSVNTEAVPDGAFDFSRNLEELPGDPVASGPNEEKQRALSTGSPMRIASPVRKSPRLRSTTSSPSLKAKAFLGSPSTSRIPVKRPHSPSPVKLARSASLSSRPPSRLKDDGSALSSLSHALEKLRKPGPSRPNTSLGFNPDRSEDDIAPTPSSRSFAQDDSNVALDPSTTTRESSYFLLRPRRKPMKQSTLLFSKAGAARGRSMMGGFTRVPKASRNPGLATVIGSPVKGGQASKMPEGAEEDMDSVPSSSAVKALEESPFLDNAVPVEQSEKSKGKQREKDDYSTRRASTVSASLSESILAFREENAKGKVLMGPPPVPDRLSARSSGTNGSPEATGETSSTPPGRRSARSAAVAAVAANHALLTKKAPEAPKSPVNLALKFLKDCVIYVDVKTEDSEEAGSLFVEMLEGVGARILKQVGQSCTHIVYKNGLQSTINKYNLLRDPKPLVVGIAWVVDCVEQRRKVAEGDYLIDLDEVSLLTNPHKRRRSLLPKPISRSFSDVPLFSESSSRDEPNDGDISMESASSVGLDDLPPLERARRRKSMMLAH
ncbi:hypothetical protein NMY22_g6226 [Coprinellus aureogranulatus]|nr:hypothetical protein NMY22_g6226 [Coprinellus aureogranulatus]